MAGACTSGTLDAGHNLPGLTAGLVGHWRFDDGAGSTGASDSSGRGNHGVLNGLDPARAWVAGRSRQALQIEHAGWVQVAASPSIDAITDHITMSAWVALEDTIGPPDIWGTALSRQIGTSIDQHYHLSLFMDRRPHLFFTTSASGYVMLNATDPVPMDSWVHIAGSYDGAMARLYVDGTEVASQAQTGSFAADTTPVLLGGNGNDETGVPTELFPGLIDELMLYARALSAEEIRQLAQGAAFPNPPGN
jgi:hypothetical protein